MFNKKRPAYDEASYQLLGIHAADLKVIFPWPAHRPAAL